MAGQGRKLEQRITVSLPREDYDALGAIADESGASVSWVVRRAVVKYLREQDVPANARQRSARAGASR